MIAPRLIATSDGAEATACRCRETVASPERSAAVAEANELAREMAGAFGTMVQSYREYYKLSALEAVQRASQTPPDNIERILNAPPDSVSWLDLDDLAQKDEALALRRWEEIKQAARDEIRSGHRAARAVQDGDGPWERARFAALRTDLIESFRPRNAAEWLLVDQLAQWQVLLWRWQEALTTWTTVASFGPRKAKKGQSYETMRIAESEALERAAQKVERLHRLYLRTLEALQRQRRKRRRTAGRRDRISVSAVYSVELT